MRCSQEGVLTSDLDKLTRSIPNTYETGTEVGFPVLPWTESQRNCGASAKHALQMQAFLLGSRLQKSKAEISLAALTAHAPATASKREPQGPLLKSLDAIGLRGEVRCGTIRERDRRGVTWPDILAGDLVLLVPLPV
jgi:hypothetical protein